MKKLVCLIGLVGLCGAVQASVLKLRVRNDANEALWYAYVYVNGRAVTVTDSLGLAQVPDDKLTLGDTVSVSYVGTKTQRIVYDKALQQEGEYVFVLPEKYNALVSDEVVVKADIEKLYRKNVERRRPYYYMSLWTADFGMKIQMPNAEVHIIAGKIKFPYILGFDTDIPRKIITSSDTTGLSWYINSDLTYALTSLHTVLYVASRPAAGTWKPSYGYLGKQDGNRIFRISYAEIQPGISYQLLLRADQQTKEVKEIEVDIADLNDGSVTHATAGITTIPREILRMIPELSAPTWIHYSFQYKDGTRVAIELDNIEVAFHNWTEKKVKQFLEED